MLQKIDAKVEQILANRSFIQFKREEIEQSISDRFEQQVKEHPHKIAVAGKEKQLTYEELNRISNRIAAAIVAYCGQQEANVIALLFEQGVMVIPAIIGVLKAGKICVPLDSLLPRLRLNYMLEDSQATLIITDSDNFSLAKELGQNQCQLLNIDENLDNYSDANCHYSVTPDNLAYILYTSGSTGQPKGVVQNHRNVLNNIRVHNNFLHISREDRLSLLATYSHNSGLTDIFRALVSGASIFPFNIRQQGVVPLADWLRENKITIYHSVPTVFRYFMNTLTEEEEFPQVRIVYLGGEKVYCRDVELYKKHFSKNCIFLNNLASTEVGTYGQYFIHKQTELDSNIVPIVCNVEDKDVMLLDKADNRVQHNGVGEIVIKSPYLALGYWRKPEPTKENFEQTSTENGSRLYRTGDLGRLLADGSLEYLGRKDSQVKIRGQRIEIPEIELALAEHGNIKKAAVTPQNNQLGEPQLIAYIVAQDQQKVVTEQLRQFLLNQLPDYMLPSTFIPLESLPLTPSGKIDRLALPKPSSEDRLSHKFVSPRTPTEEQSAAIWSSVLGIKKVGIHDNFFELGGHSIFATQIISRIRQTFQVELPLRVLLESPTVAELSDRIDTILWVKSTSVPSTETNREEGEL